VIGFVIAGDS